MQSDNLLHKSLGKTFWIFGTDSVQLRNNFNYTPARTNFTNC